MPSVADTLTDAGMRKALGISMFMSMIRGHADLELLLSLECGDTYIF